MKTKSVLFTALMTLAISGSFSSCEKDVPASLAPEVPAVSPEYRYPIVSDTLAGLPSPHATLDALVGSWNIISFRFDDHEYLGSIVKSASFRFFPPLMGYGEFRQEVNYADGESHIVFGKYEMDEAGQVVKMTSEEETITARIAITNGNSLEWVSAEDWVQLTIKATKQ